MKSARKDGFWAGSSCNASANYIENVLNDDYGKNIDLSEYIYVSDSDNEVSENVTSHSFKWRKIINQIIVHEVHILTTPYGEVYNWTVYPPPPEDVLDDICDFTDEDYIDIVEPLMRGAFANENEEFTLTDVKMYPLSRKLIYIHGAGRFAINFTASCDVSLPDGTQMDDYHFGFYLPVSD